MERDFKIGESLTCEASATGNTPVHIRRKVLFFTVILYLFAMASVNANDYVLSFEERDLRESTTSYSSNAVFLNVRVNGDSVYYKDMGNTGPLWNETVPFRVDEPDSVEIEFRLVLRAYQKIDLNFGNIRVRDANGGEVRMEGSWVKAESRPEFLHRFWPGIGLPYREGFMIGVPEGDTSFHSLPTPEWASYIWRGSLKPAVNLVMNRLYEYVGCYESLNYFNDYNNISFDPVYPMPGEQVKITATLWNRGSKEAANVPLKLMIGGREIDREIVNVGPMDSLLIDFYWTAVEGFHAVAVIADPEGIIEETQTDDNSLLRTLTVGNVQTAHPYMFFRDPVPSPDLPPPPPFSTPDRLSELRQRIYAPANASTAGRYYNYIKNNYSKNRAYSTSEVTNALVAMHCALVYAIDGEDAWEWKERALFLIDSSINMTSSYEGQVAGYYGVAYDLLAPFLTEEENRMFRSRLARWVKAQVTKNLTRTYSSHTSGPGYPRPFGYQQYSQGDYLRVCGLAVGALALNGYDDRFPHSPDYDPSGPSYGYSDTWVHLSLNFFWNEVVRTMTNSAGYYREGLAYMGMAENRTGALFYNAFANVGYNLFNIWPLTADMHTLAIKHRMPNGWLAPENDSQIWGSMFSGHILYSHLYDDPVDQTASSWAMHNLPFSLDSGDLYDHVGTNWMLPFLLYDTDENRSITPSNSYDPTMFLVDHNVFRNDWSEDSAFLMLSSKHTPTASVSHDQNDQGSFMMYAKRAFLAIDPGYGQGGGGAGTFMEDVVKPACRANKYAHNMVLVNDQVPRARGTGILTSGVYTSGNSYFPENTFVSLGMDFAESVLTDWEFLIGAGRNVIDHRRSVIFPKGTDYFIIIDDLESQIDKNNEYSFILQGNALNPFKDDDNPGDFIRQPTAIEQVPLQDNLTVLEEAGGRTAQWMINNWDNETVRFRGFFAAPSPDKLNITTHDGWLGYKSYYAARNRYIQAKVAGVQNTKYLVVLFPDMLDDPSDNAVIERLDGSDIAGTRENAAGVRIILANGLTDMAGVQGPGGDGVFLTLDNLLRSDGEIMYSRTNQEQILQTCFMARGKKLYYEHFWAPLISSNKTLDVIALHFIDAMRITGHVSGEGTYELSLLTFSGPVSATFNGIPIPHTYNPATGISTLTLTGEGHLDIERQPSIKEAQQLPTEITLHGAAPNPFNPSTTLSFSLPSNSQARLMIYGISGQKVRELASGYFEAGRYNAVWDGHDDRGNQVSSGAYFWRIETPKKNSPTARIMLLK